MIDPRYVQAMARYNSWQNGQLVPVLEAMDASELTCDRGSFFGSILGTANHLLWGDQIWMSRFDKGVDAPAGGIPSSPQLHPTVGSWSAQRFWLDGRIRIWADNLKAIDLEGDLSWYSGALGQDVTAPLAMTVMHFFNHQTHHRGQLHAMLTAAGQKAPVSDLFIMPKDA